MLNKRSGLTTVACAILTALISSAGSLARADGNDHQPFNETYVQSESVCASYDIDCRRAEQRERDSVDSLSRPDESPDRVYDEYYRGQNEYQNEGGLRHCDF